MSDRVCCVEVEMKLQKMVFMVSVILLSLSSVSVEASDFAWIRDFNLRAEADLVGFRARLAARFKIGEAQVQAVLSRVEGPADAYMVLRLGEMAGKSIDLVLEQYRVQKGKGWGELAKSLGIKPGSKEFHALKRGSDLYEDKDKGKSKGSKTPSHDKSKGKN